MDAVCLAIAVFRARVLPIRVGVAVPLSVVSAFFLHGGSIVFVSDDVLFAALCWIGLRAARPAAGLNQPAAAGITRSARRVVRAVLETERGTR